MDNDIQEDLGENAQPTGALLDDRVLELKQKDYLHEELFSGENEVVWEEKDLDTLKRYSPRDQKSSLSCVANGIATTLEAFEEQETSKTIVFSHKDAYIRRLNRPYGGMFMDDAFKIARDGVAYEYQVPSMKLNETDINKEYEVTSDMIQARAKHASLASVVIVSSTFDKVASVLDTGTPVIPFWFFNDKQSNKEWWNKFPKVIDEALGVYDEAAARHQAVIVDYTLIEGKKYLVIQDSAGVGKGDGNYKDLRYVSEEFFARRCYAIGYLIDKKNLDYVVDEKPRAQFVRHLKVGMTGPDVKALQKILVYEKLMLLKTPTELFGGMTLAGVKKLQEKYKDEILLPLGLKAATGYVGQSTLKWLKENYS